MREAHSLGRGSAYSTPHRTFRIPRISETRFYRRPSGKSLLADEAMTEMTEFQNLHEVGVEILKLFKQVKNIDTTVDGGTTGQEWSRGAIAAEADRFELWSINLGLFVSGHGSLDYRLRQAENLKQTIGTFLSNLNTALKEGQCRRGSRGARFTNASTSIGVLDKQEQRTGSGVCRRPSCQYPGLRWSRR